MTYIVFQHFGQSLPRGHALKLPNFPKNEVFKPQLGQKWSNLLETFREGSSYYYEVTYTAFGSFRQLLRHGHAQNLPNFPENEVFQPQPCQKWLNLAEYFRKCSFHYYEVTNAAFHHFERISYEFHE